MTNLDDYFQLEIDVLLTLKIADTALSSLTISKILGENDEAILLSLDRLWKAKILTNEGKENRYSITDSRLGQTVYKHANSAKRMLLHSNYAHLLAHSSAQKMGIEAWEIGHHFEKGGDVQSAAGYYLNSIEHITYHHQGRWEFKLQQLVALIQTHPFIQINHSHVFWLQAVQAGLSSSWDDPLVGAYLKVAQQQIEYGAPFDLELKILIVHWLRSHNINDPISQKKIAHDIFHLVNSQDISQFKPVAHLILGINLLLDGRLAPAERNFLRALDMIKADKPNFEMPFWMPQLNFLIPVALIHTYRKLGYLRKAYYVQHQSSAYLSYSL